MTKDQTQGCIGSFFKYLAEEAEDFVDDLDEEEMSEVYHGFMKMIETNVNSELLSSIYLGKLAVRIFGLVCLLEAEKNCRRTWECHVKPLKVLR